jgi:hypothetical protein
MDEFKIQDGDVIFVVKPNTSEDPLKAYENCRPYNPLMIEELKVASSFYKSENENLFYNNRTVFDVYGTSGTKNKGIKDGTRMVNAALNGINTPDDDIIKPFFTKEEAIKYKQLMTSEKHINDTLEITLDGWGMSDPKAFRENMVFTEESLFLFENKVN